MISTIVSIMSILASNLLHDSIMILIRKTNMKCSALENKTNACREWASERGDLITVDNCLRVDLVIKLTPKTFSLNILAVHREAPYEERVKSC